jgi:NAD(P)-dependent dehydrogenase (short-subunit alcohol dehydrogenase family)
MRLDLSGRTALVTGSTQGIGLAIATGLAAAGARVAINGRDRDKVLAALPAEGDFVAAPADLTTDEGLGALLAVSRGFAKEAAGSGVTVNSVIAGPTHTGGVEEFVYQLVGKDLPWDRAQREFMRLHRPQSLLQRLIEPEEIANMVVYLSSPQASATTGGALRVDGGYVDAILP